MDKPIIFGMAKGNYARRTRRFALDAIIATGRSDFQSG
jgi:hypothetical protein